MPTVTSTASILLSKEETFGFDNLAPTIGQFRQTFFDTDSSVAWGKIVGKVTFKFERVVFKFSNMTPTIPPNAKILSCVLRGTPGATSDVQTFFTLIFPHAKDGFWNPVDSGRIWRRVGNSKNADMQVELFDGFLNTIVDTNQVTNQVWAIRDNSFGRYLRIGQGVTAEDTKFIAFCDIQLRRVGAVAVGNIWAEIYSQGVFGFAVNLLATSDVRPASAPGTTFSNFRFTFSGGNLYEVADGERVVVVLNGDYPLSSTNRIQVGWKHVGNYPIGFMQIDGTGVAFDDQNYGLHSDYRSSIANATAGSFIVWIAPQFILGVPVSTPDLSPLFQQVISSPTYSEGEAFSWAVAMSEFLFPSGVTAQRTWANALHATLPPVEMIVEWKERAVRVAA